MGLELNVYKTVRSLRSYRFITLTLVWSWIIGPALAYFITKILPLSAPHAAGLLLFGLAPTSPMLPILIRKVNRREDMSENQIELNNARKNHLGRFVEF